MDVRRIEKLSGLRSRQVSRQDGRYEQGPEVDPHSQKRPLGILVEDSDEDEDDDNHGDRGRDENEGKDGDRDGDWDNGNGNGNDEDGGEGEKNAVYSSRLPSVRVSTRSLEREKFETIVKLACSLQNDASWAHNSRQAAVLQAKAPSLRLFHILDLLRLLDIFNYRNQMDALDPNHFPVLLAAVLKPFTTEWIPLKPEVADGHKQLPLKNMPLLRSLIDIFYPRWGDSRSGFFLHQDFSQLIGNNRNFGLRMRPLVCFCSLLNAQASSLLTHGVQDGGPLFYFTEDASCFRPRLWRSESVPVLEFQLRDFCQHILGRHDPLEANARIVELQRYQRRGLRHQFILLHCTLDTQAAHLYIENYLPPKLDFWLRVERAADRASQNPWSSPTLSSSSIFPPDDKVSLTLVSSDSTCLILKQQVLVAFDPSDLLTPRTTTTKSSIHSAPRLNDSELLTGVKYPEHSTQVTVRELARILDVFQAVSTRYVLLTVSPDFCQLGTAL